MTPMLVFFFGVDPLTAVSSDLVAGAVMKPVVGAVHLRRGTVITRLVKWLVIGSVPAAFVAVWAAKSFLPEEELSGFFETAIGIALVLAAIGLMTKAALASRNARLDDHELHTINVFPVRTLLIGVFGGAVVGLTSVGSGSLMMVLLLTIYPILTAKQLVGTDLVQATPLVLSAALGPLIFGDVELGLTTSLILGAVPATYVGARISSSAADEVIRPLLAIVLTSSGLKLLGAPTAVVAVGAVLMLGAYFGMLLRGRRAKRALPAPVAGT
jgi:uncharacterized membrane protein YfcA